MATVALRCHKSDCRRPWGHIYNGVLTVESRHEGKTHTNAIALMTLLQLLKDTRQVANNPEMMELLDQANLPLVQPVLVDNGRE